MDYYYEGAWRMDWGLGNPNTTATMIACLMLATWSLAYIEKLRGFWLALPLFLALGCCLIQTYSRGGMLALLAGSAVLLAGAPRPWRKSRSIGVIFAVASMALIAILAGALHRYEDGFYTRDQSIASRLLIWGYFPEILAAAPWGCGWGRAGDFYTQWFQPTDESVNYLNLINSHLTWMAEGGWAFSVLYLFGWSSIIITCWPREGGRFGSLPLAIWVALGVGAFFSHVEQALWVWIVPLASLGYAVVERFRFRQAPNPGEIAFAAAGSFAIVLLLIAIGRASAPWPITSTREAVSLGCGAKVTIVYIDRAVMGQLYGHTLRKFLAENRQEREGRTYIVTESAAFTISPGASEVVVAGRMVRRTLIASGTDIDAHVIIINPECLPVETRWDAALASRSSLYWGEYSDFPARSFWPDISGPSARVVAGAGDFVPGWPRVIWKPAGT